MAKSGSGKAGKAKTPPKGRPTSGRVQRRRAAQAEARRKRMTTIGVVAAGLLIVLGAVAWAVASSSGDDSAGAVTDPESFDLPERDGDGRVRLADFAGTPTVVNFFASWCTQCERELPDFAEAAQNLDGEVDFVFVNSNETGDWRAMAERNGIIGYPMAKDVGGTQDNGLFRNLRGQGMPLTAFYDAQGSLVDVVYGAVTRSSLTDLMTRHYDVAPFA